VRLLVIAAALAAPAVLRAHVGVEALGQAIDAELASRPHDPDAHIRRAEAHLLAGGWDAALAEVYAARQHGAAPDLLETTRGRILLASGHAREARAAFGRAIRRNPQAYGAFFERGRAWLALGKPRRAADDFGRAIAGLATPQPEQVIARRDALVAIGRRAEAVRALDEGMARIGRVASLELAAVALEEELGHYDGAIRRLDALLASGPPNPVLVARRGELLARAGRPAEARVAYASARAMIDARPAARRAGPFADLRQRLDVALAADQGESP
jgi:tetratricopeptide (TPR) repeat protein